MMKDTKIIQPVESCLNLAKQELLHGEIVAIPTETVYGLGADATNPHAIEKIFQVKGRPQDNPLIVHISDIQMIHRVVGIFSKTAQALAETFWPGPLTMVLPKHHSVPFEVSAGLDTVGVRMPSHQVARAFIRLCNVPIAAPSANLSGKPSPTKAQHVYQDLNGKISYIIDGGECAVGLESTVISVGDDEVTILRPGKITMDDLLHVVQTVKIDNGVFTKLEEHQPAASPGMKYKHYSPNAEIIMLDGTLAQFEQYVQRHLSDKTGVLVFDGEENRFSIPCVTYGEKDNSDQQAASLFDSLREIDKLGLKKVYARMPSKTGVGLAVYNRLVRACGFQMISLKRPIIIGLTGQTGSGKTTVSQIFSEHKVSVLNCDQIARQVIERPEVIEKLTGYFGTAILDQNQALNRKKLGNLVFGNAEYLSYLNHVMYPRITKVVEQQVQQLHQHGCKWILLDAPTLFESGINHICDYVVSVLAPKEIREDRIIKRDFISVFEAAKRMSAQHDDEFYSAQSDEVIKNDGSQEDLKEKTVQIIKKIKENINGDKA